MRAAIVYKIYTPEGDLVEERTEISEGIESLLKMWKKIKGRHRKIRKTHRVEYWAVNRSFPLPPPERVLLPLKYCPYCGTGRFFPRTVYDVNVCEVCGVSNNEYYVKKFN